MAGRGRGKEATLPAWMTAGESFESNSNNKAISDPSPMVASVPVSPVVSTSPFVSGVVPPSISGYNPPPTGSHLGFPGYLPPRPTFAPNYAPMGSNPSPMFNNQFAPRPVGFTPMNSNVPNGGISDPNNNAKSWSEYKSPEGRKYWHNRETQVCTYDKPLCLMTPEERSIPPCKWKEYNVEGKTYYSDGKESLWEPPQEFLEWKQKMDAIERKKIPAPPSAPHSLSRTSSSNSITDSVNKKAVDDSKNIPVYASQQDAMEAFKCLLSDKDINSTMKLKDVTDLCGDDVRWMALKTAGERRQALAEYQTKRAKLEKEIQKQKAKKHRDAFFLMLAEFTSIDSRTRWSQASEMLQKDPRFQNVEDPRDREDIFQEFIDELLKKDREDRSKAREKSLNALRNIVKEFVEEDKIRHNTSWNSIREILLEKARQTDARHLEETDARRIFQEMADDLRKQHLKEEERKKEEKIKSLETLSDQFKEFLQSLWKVGTLKPWNRWSEVENLTEIKDSEIFKNLLECVISVFQDGLSRFGPKWTFDRVFTDLFDIYLSDKKVIAEIVNYSHVSIDYETTFDRYLDLCNQFLNWEEDPSQVSVFSSVLSSSSTSKEDGEEDDEDLNGNSAASKMNAKDDSKMMKLHSLALNLRSIMQDRVHHIRYIFDDLHDRLVQEHETAMRHLKKKEDRFKKLLEDYFYRSDHIDIVWDDAKRSLERHSAYDSLGKSDRRRLFAEHLDNLKKKMESKSKSFKNSQLLSSLPANSENNNGENERLSVNDSATEMNGSASNTDSSNQFQSVSGDCKMEEGEELERSQPQTDEVMAQSQSICKQESVVTSLPQVSDSFHRSHSVSSSDSSSDDSSVSSNDSRQRRNQGKRHKKEKRKRDRHDDDRHHHHHHHKKHRKDEDRTRDRKKYYRSRSRSRSRS